MFLADRVQGARVETIRYPLAMPGTIRDPFILYTLKDVKNIIVGAEEGKRVALEISVADIEHEGAVKDAFVTVLLEEEIAEDEPTQARGMIPSQTWIVGEFVALDGDDWRGSSR